MVRDLMHSDSPGEAAGSLRCTLVIPTYNAIDFIGATVEQLGAFVRRHADWCVLFVCDGCSDGTPERLAELAEGHPRMRVESYTQNRGKGYAVRRGLSLASTPYRIFTDVDLAYDPEEAVKMLAVLEQGADLVAVNRASPESTFLISPRDFPGIYKRHLMSRAFNWWLRRVLPITILDTQAGLKGLRGEAWERLAPLMQTDGFFVDVELLARAATLGMRIEEVPVLFKYVDPTTVRMVSHGWHMIKDTLAFRRRLTREAQRAGAPAASPMTAAAQPS